MTITESILGGLRQPVLVLDEAFKPQFANPAFFDLFELPSAALTGNPIVEFVSGGRCIPPLKDVLEAIINNDANDGEVAALYTLPAGKRLFLVINAKWIRVSDASEILLVEPRDVTDTMAAKQQSSELNKALQTHSTTLDALNKELESYSRSVSHDLRMPLRFVNRIAHLLLTEPGSFLSETAMQQVNMILQATTEMARLIDRLLLFSHTGQTPITPRRVNLRRLCQDVVKELQQSFDDGMVDIEIQELPPCKGDRTLLKAVMSNLLENAFKFTQGGEWAQVTVGCTEAGDEMVYFVQDNGIGFDMEEADALFIPFHRLHKKTDFAGVGLGLALVKRIVERHNGRVWCESERTKGTTFYFTLGGGAYNQKKESST